MKTIRKLLALIFVCTILIPTSNYAYADERIICADDGFFPNESVSIYNNDEGKIMICYPSQILMKMDMLQFWMRLQYKYTYLRIDMH